MEIICTIGPTSDNKETLSEMKKNGMTFARINLSHVGIDYVKKIIPLCNELGISLIIDTEGSQVRTGILKKNIVVFDEDDIVTLHNDSMDGDEKNLHLWPIGTVKRLKLGDMISVDFDTLLLTVVDIKDIDSGTVKAKVINGGFAGTNKSVIIEDNQGIKMEMPVLSKKDKEVIEYSIKNGVKHVAASFMNCSDDVIAVRKFIGNSVKIISKIESKKALNNLSSILEHSDFALIDRGDLSKEIGIEKIPLTQKIILKNGSKANVPVFVATNLLESMTESRTPTKAEVNDIINTILDGASGLVLAGETAVGKYPVECVKMLNKLIQHSQIVNDVDASVVQNKVVERLQELDYLDSAITGNLVEPHGGKLVNRMLKTSLEQNYLSSLQKIKLDDNRYMDAEQIAIGTYSPLEGFMCKEDFLSVLDNMRLKNGVPWTIPIVLDIDHKEKKNLAEGQEVALVDQKNEIVGTMKIEEIYSYDKKAMIKKLFGTDSEEHPGVVIFNKMKDYFIGGQITLIKRKESEFKEYELTPSQTRKIFIEKGWKKIIGFHTRNVIHRAHEYIQLTALKKENCDGLFVHPIIGKKKKGDFNAEYIIKSYDLMLKKYYPKGKVVFATFSSYSRYAGPREAIFTAICRKNFGCSHFIVGRDHTGVKDFYSLHASHEIFDKFPDLNMTIVKFNNVLYSKKQKTYVDETEIKDHLESDKSYISGTDVRKMLERGESPPEWFMRPEISQMLIKAIKEKKEVFVR